MILAGQVWVRNGEVRRVERLESAKHRRRVVYWVGEAVFGCRREDFNRWATQARLV